jgi:hypothetical protein
LSALFDRLVGAHGYPSLSLLHDLSAYVFAAAAVLGLLVLFRRKTLGWFALPIMLVAILVAGACYWVRDSIEDRVGTARLEVLSAMRQRPADPWPRGTSHVVLGRIGSTELEKAYLEPGGSFSPSPGSFGVSFWVVDRSGALVTTSDDIPLDRTRATYERYGPPETTAASHWRSTHRPRVK